MSQREVALEVDDTQGDVTNLATATSVTKTKGTVARNPAAVAIARVSSILDSLDPTTRSIVAQFVVSQYC